MANGINPYQLAAIANRAKQSQVNVQNWQKQDALDTAKHVGHETEIFKDKTRDIKERISERLGRPLGSGIDQLGSLLQLTPLGPLGKAIGVGLTKFLGGSRHKRKAKRAIADSENILGELDSKYEKSWLGNYMKDFVSGYEQQFTDMRQELPSSSEMIMGSIIDGLMAYGQAGGKSEQARIDAGGARGGWAGGLFEGSTPDTPTTNIPTADFNFDTIDTSIPNIDWNKIFEELHRYTKQYPPANPL